MVRNPKNFFINFHLQAAQIYYSMANYVLGCASMGIAVFVAYSIFTYRASDKQTLLQLKLIDFFVSIGFPTIIGVCVLLGIVFVVPFAIITSHRTAGPIVALRRYIKALQAGDYQAPLHLRDGDELKEIALELKNLASQLEHQRIYGVKASEPKTDPLAQKSA